MKRALILSVFLLIVIGFNAYSADRAEFKIYDDSKIDSKSYRAVNEGMILSADRLIKIDESFTGLGIDQGSLRDVIHLHPTIGDAFNDTLIRGYQNHETLPDGYIWWNGSENDGASWDICCAWDMYGATYPEADYSGSASLFYAAFTVPPTFQSGGAPVFLTFPDIFNPSTWGGYFAPWNTYGFHDMKFVDLAVNRSPHSWNWGYEAMIISRTSGEGNLYDAPAIFRPYDGAGNTWMTWLANHDSCKTASAALDQVTGKTYAVYDRYDWEDDQYQLTVRQNLLSDWDIPAVIMDKSFADPDQHIRYPVSAANDGNVIVAAAVYHDSAPTDFDIVCWITDDGNPDNLNTMVSVAASPESENYPDIEFVENETFVLTYIMDGGLYAVRTDDAGVTWGIPELVSDPGEMVSEEYRASDLSAGGRKVIYQYTTGRADIAINNKDLGTLDPDGDGIGFLVDNCQATANSDQGDSDGDLRGNACDNCPNIPNYYQEDGDGDGIGDVCDNCFGEPQYDPTDHDEDGLTNDVDPDDDNDGFDDIDDNCPLNYNPDQLDSNSDDRGDACDYTCGDVNEDGDVNILDIIEMINAKFKCGEYPRVQESADADANGLFNILDIIWMIDYKFASGPGPICE